MNIIKDGKYVVRKLDTLHECWGIGEFSFMSISMSITLLPLECAPTYEWEA